MKQLFLTLLPGFLLMTACANFRNETTSIPSSRITIEQYGKVVIPSNGIFYLDKKEFDIIIDLPKPMAVLVNTTFGQGIAAKGRSMASRPEFQEENRMAVSLFNEERTIYVSEEASSPWYYENEQDHNFNYIQDQKGQYRCTRTVKYFHESDAGRIPIEDMDESVFIVIAPENIQKLSPDSADMMGQFLRIEWNGSVELSASEIAKDGQQAEYDEPNDDEHSALINAVITQLELDRTKIHPDFISSITCPDNPEESLVLIPVIVEEEEDYFLLSTYFVIADNKTKSIINDYFEPKSIQSDAIYLTSISIDTMVYQLTEYDQAYGLKISHRSMSQPNPYSTTILSLYLKSGEEFTKILRDYTVSEFSGEGDARCKGEFIQQEKTLLMSTDKTNSYYNILVKDTLTEIIGFEGANGECNSKEKKTYQEHVLKLNGEEYTKNGESLPRSH